MVPQCSSGNCEEELSKKPVGRLSVNCRPTHYRQFTDRLPTANRQATDSFPKKKIVSYNCVVWKELNEFKDISIFLL